MALLLQPHPRPGRPLGGKEWARQHYFHFADGSEKAMAPYSGTLAWKIPWTEEPGGLQSMGSRRVGHD